MDDIIFWSGNILAALVFAGFHLPHILSSETPNWNLVYLIIIFNGIAGIALGWLYARYCLLSAIVAHFIADFVQHVVPRIVVNITTI